MLVMVCKIMDCKVTELIGKLINDIYANLEKIMLIKGIKRDQTRLKKKK